MTGRAASSLAGYPGIIALRTRRSCNTKQSYSVGLKQTWRVCGSLRHKKGRQLRRPLSFVLKALQLGCLVVPLISATRLTGSALHRLTGRASVPRIPTARGVVVIVVIAWPPIMPVRWTDADVNTRSVELELRLRRCSSGKSQRADKTECQSGFP